MQYESQYYGAVEFNGPYLWHHGVKGQKWGVRRWQNVDGSLTNAGRIHYGYGNGKRAPSDAKSKFKRKTAEFVLEKYSRVKLSQIGKGSDIGKKYVDTYVKMDTPLYRIQSSETFENFAFYATYKKHDVDEYAGLFGKNLMSRADAEAKRAEKEADKTGNYDDAKALRDRADNMNVYQLKIQSTSKLKVPSEQNASAIVARLMRDKEFNDDLKESIRDSASKMLRPSQQMLFKEAAKAMTKDPKSLSDADKSVIYKALNLSLTNHNDQEVRMQSKFYGALKEKGYSALLDLNDKSYSSYHAHSPVIVFDTDRVKLQSVTKMNPDSIEKLYKKHNRERIIKDIPEQVVGNLAKAGGIRISKISDKATNYMVDYLQDKKR